MLNTAFAPIDNDAPTSSDPDRNLNVHAWGDPTPEQLFQRGYVERADFAPSPAQSAVSTETNVEVTGEGDDLTSTTIRSSDPLIIKLPVPVSMALRPTLHALQEWEGYVLEKRVDEFVALLSDLTSGDTRIQSRGIPKEEAIIPLAEISNDDVKKLRLGSIFRWVIGYERSPSGTKRRVSQIVFRDLPTMTEQDRRAGAEWAKRVTQSLAD